jgi:hypothetical protein
MSNSWKKGSCRHNIDLKCFPVAKTKTSSLHDCLTQLLLEMIRTEMFYRILPCISKECSRHHLKKLFHDNGALFHFIFFPTITH